MSKNKYIYGWKLSVNYGQGWEYEIFEKNFTDIKQRKKEYMKDCKYPIKISKCRELNN